MAASIHTLDHASLPHKHVHLAWQKEHFTMLPAKKQPCDYTLQIIGQFDQQQPNQQTLTRDTANPENDQHAQEMGQCSQMVMACRTSSQGPYILQSGVLSGAVTNAKGDAQL